MPLELQFDEDIRCPPEELFDVIVDLRAQDRWLGKSSAFRGTEQISHGPVTLGTAYREPGPLAVRNGTVTELDRPRSVTFHQPMTLRLGLGTIDIVLRYSLLSGPDSTRVTRHLTLRIPGLLRPLQPLLLQSFKAENRRVLSALKAYAERPGSRTRG